MDILGLNKMDNGTKIQPVAACGWKSLFWECLRRGTLQLCPCCGKANLYRKWNMLHDQCPHCGLGLEKRAGDTWFFRYMTTAFLTGVIVLYMFLFPPQNYLLGRIVVVLLWFVLIVLTLPYRKSIGIAVNYLLEERKDRWGESPDEVNEHQ